MLKRAFSFLMLTMFLISTITVAFNIQAAKAASETIVDTEVGESRFTTYPQRQSPYYWVHVQNHDTFYTRAYSNNFWYTLCGADGHGEPLYYGTWQASLPSSGIYEVFVWIPNPDAFQYDGRTYTPTQSAIYQIYHSGGVAVKTVNQRLRTGGWYSLGSYTFGTSASVILNDRTGETYLSTMLAFDAIKFVGEDVNHAPYEPYNPSPYPHESGVLVTKDLSWSGGDPDGDSVTYYVYFGLSSSPPLVSSGQSATTYNPSLSYAMTYYWKIVSRDEHGLSTAGSVWDFTTQSPPSNQPTLHSGYVSPSSGDTSTTFSYYVTYSDPEGDAPTTKYVYIDGSPCTMAKISGDYVSGAVFKYSTTLSAGSHNYYFYFADSVHSHVVRLPATGAYTGPNVPPPPTPDFLISASPTSLSIQQGSSGSSTITITSINSFNQPIQLSISGAPSGVTATMSPSQATPPAGGTATSTSTVSVGATATAGSYTLTVTGTSGALTHSTYISLEITAAPPPSNQPPTSIVRLRISGADVVETDQGKRIEIYVGDSADDKGIATVMFSSDDFQDGTPTGQWTESFNWNSNKGEWNAGDKTIGWRFSTSGMKEVWALITDVDGNAVWNHAEILIHPGYAIIVAGEGGWREQWGIDTAAENAYRSLRSLGFDDDHIVYLNSKFPRDVDNDGTNEVDGYAARSYFEDALEGIRSKIAGEPTPLVLYLTGHGASLTDTDGVGFYFGNWVSPDDYLFNDRLSQLLDEFSAKTPMLIVLGCCYSGLFITSSKSISAQNRIIITAAHDGKRNYIGWLQSSDRFWGNLENGLNVKDAFITRALWGDNHNMWLDDNGDKVGHPPNDLQSDGALAANTRIGYISGGSLALVNWEYQKLCSPGEIRIYDSMNRVTGMVSGQVKEEIPSSFFEEEYNTVVIYGLSGSYLYQIAGNETGSYGLDIVRIEDGVATTFNATDIPTSSGCAHQFTVDWVALSGGQEGVTIKVDSDGDGVFEYTFTSDSELTPAEFNLETGGLNATGDLNQDGIVDIFDLAMAATAFGSNPEDPRWNQYADVNFDNTIDIFDLVIVVLRFSF